MRRRVNRQYFRTLNNRCVPTSAGGGASPPSQTLLEQSMEQWQALQQWAQRQWERRHQKSGMVLADEHTDNVLHEQVVSATQLMISMSMQTSVTSPYSLQVLTLANMNRAGLFTLPCQTEVSSQSDVKLLISGAEASSSTVSSSGQSTHLQVSRFPPVTNSCLLMSVCFSASSSSYSELFERPARCYLPTWFRWVGWALSFITCAVSIAYTAILCQQFQHARYILWLQTVFVAFLFCNFVTQPLSVLFKALFMAIRYRKDPTVSNMCGVCDGVPSGSRCSIAETGSRF